MVGWGMGRKGHWGISWKAVPGLHFFVRDFSDAWLLDPLGILQAKNLQEPSWSRDSVGGNVARVDLAINLEATCWVEDWDSSSHAGEHSVALAGGWKSGGEEHLLHQGCRSVGACSISVELL